MKSAGHLLQLLVKSLMKDRAARVALGAVLAFSLLFGFARESSGQAGVTPSEINVGIEKIEIRVSGTIELHTVFFEPDPSGRRFAINPGVNANPGDVISGLVSGVEIPAGSYDLLRVTIDCTIRIIAEFASQGGTIYTKSNGVPSQTPPAESMPVTIPAGQGCVDGSIPFPISITLNVEPGEDATIQYNINAVNSMNAQQQGQSADFSPNYSSSATITD